MLFAEPGHSVGNGLLAGAILMAVVAAHRMYNPLAKEDAKTVDEFDNVMDIPIGGLGILLVKKNVDEIAYERENGTSNVITLKKSW